MNFQESVDSDMNFYVFARDLNKHLIDLNYIMISTVNDSSSIRVYRLPLYEDGDDSPYSFFIIDYTLHIIAYRNIPKNDTYWNTFDFQREIITLRELDTLKNMAIKIQEQLKKNKVENKIKELEKDFV